MTDMSHPANTESPAVAEVVKALRSAIPLLAAPERIGTIRADASRHTAGLAIDIMLNSRAAYEKYLADEIIEALVDMQSDIGWHDILYTDWNPDGTPFHFSIPGSRIYQGDLLKKNKNKDEALGRKHENHVHIDWVDFSLRLKGNNVLVYDWPPDAMKKGFGQKLFERLAFVSRE
ncbi:hypothetical protein [Paracraurococcus lichenis]|uniref:Uncharacterized protein n=1 Tax=Paracraurococcus lichenis TaxID=3064888 RepID=A0ABT9E4Y8_9PROT|nr:hypothetical protein [Paracraurococcus sp. LOR1-02]MDO9711140.1 hypothetical protein [Paracraurococcus sp. LOR1-02]